MVRRTNALPHGRRARSARSQSAAITRTAYDEPPKNASQSRACLRSLHHLVADTLVPGLIGFTGVVLLGVLLFLDGRMPRLFWGAFQVGLVFAAGQFELVLS